jgi:integrase
MLKWRAVRAGVGVTMAVGPYDTPGGKTSRMSAHALRRAWAHEALNDPVDPQPLDVVSEVLKHKDTATTRIHYAATKPRTSSQRPDRISPVGETVPAVTGRVERYSESNVK